jgi:hypothetical protein
VGPDDRGQPDDVISAARADVCDSRPGFDAKRTHELAWFAGCVALFFIVPNRANDIRNRSIGARKRISRRARIRYELLRRARYSEYGGKEGGNYYSHHITSVTLGANVRLTAHCELAEYFSNVPGPATAIRIVT